MSYAQVIRSRAERRRMVLAANEVAKLAYSDDSNVQDIKDKLSKTLNSILLGEQREGETISSALSRLYDNVEANSALVNKGQMPSVGLLTGFYDLDKILIGIEPEEFVLIAGRPGHGKSAFMMNLLRNMTLKQGRRAAIFSQDSTCNKHLGRQPMMSNERRDARLDRVRYRVVN